MSLATSFSQPAALAALCLLLVSCPALANPVLRISADDSELENNLDASLSLNLQECELSVPRETLLVRRLRREAEAAARAVGFYQPQFNFTVSREKNCWTMLLEATSGPPMLLAKPQISLTGSGQQDSALLALISNSPVQENTRLMHNDYDNLRDSLARTASARGYLHYQWQRHQIAVDPDNHQATVFLAMDTGERYRFGNISIEQDSLKPEFVRRYLPFNTGDYWDTQLLLKSQQALLGSGYYNTSRLERGAPDEQTLSQDVTLHLTPKRRFAYLAGVGVSTDTGPRLRLGVEDRYLTGSGHRWRAESEISAIRFGSSASYEIPLADPLKDRLVFTTSYSEEDNDAVENRQLRLGVNLISEWDNGWVFTRSLDYEQETFELGAQKDTTYMLLPGVQLQKIRADHSINPRKGWKLGGSLRGSHPSISNIARFAQGRTWAKGIVPLHKGRAIARFDLGYTQVAAIENLPASVRFFAGGDSSIRGFRYSSLGPLDNNGDVIGGRHLAVGSLEFDYPIVGNWHAAVFTDMGNAFEDFDDFETRYAAGLGLRWRSPLGPIRVDVARPVDGDLNWRLHLSMGPDL